MQQNFPLDSFLQRLELAGFYVGPGQRLRLLRLLEGAGKRYLDQPEKLKYIICPVVAQGRADQDRFYEIFDQYWTEVSKPWEMPLTEKAPVDRPWFLDWIFYLLAAVVLVAMGWAAYQLFKTPEGPAPKVFFKHQSETPGKVVFGDTAHFENLSENYDSTQLFRWEVHDRDLMEEMASDTSGTSPEETMEMFEEGHDFSYYSPKIVGSPRKMVKLILPAIPPLEADTVSINFDIHCAFPPVIDTLLSPQGLRENDEAEFTLFLGDTAGVVVHWDMGDGKGVVKSNREFVQNKSGSFEQKFTYRFIGQGKFDVKLIAERNKQEGICEVIEEVQVNIGRENAFLMAKPLYSDKLNPEVYFAPRMWYILGILALAMIWFWIKWGLRKAPEIEQEKKEKEDLAAAAKKFEAPDKGPYFIPFRSQAGHIRVEREMYRLANVMRQRQEGLRNEMDVPTSVNETIAAGGFPKLLTQRDMVPTEYLFLLDERKHNSHQGRLFEFMVEFLQRREVLGEVYYFNQRLHSFWNDQHPEGLTPEKLYRLYSNHRVVVLSDAHTFIEPGGKILRPEVKRLFSSWKERLLLTPLPLVSWTWREGVLHEMFPVFPSHTNGLAEAAKYLERGMDDEENRPTYASWCERLGTEKLGDEHFASPDVNYRNWRTAADHADYLKGHPLLYKWLKALAVYPKPDWNITLAIGRALAPLGVELHYDNLLLLSRIPWLVNGELPPRLRKELLADLDSETEQLAREAVRKEMEAVESLVRGSHANREHQVELALQHFMLDTQKAQNRDLVRQMIALNLLSPRQVTELNKVALQKMTAHTKTASVVRPNRDPKQILAFLEQKEEEAEKPKKPFFTRDFYWASLFTVLCFLLMFSMGKYNGKEQLSRFIGENSTPSTTCSDTLLYAKFFERKCNADLAVRLQNSAVELWNNALNDASGRGNEELQSVAQENNDSVAVWFAQALSQRKGGYPLAKSNQLKFKYNLGVHDYHAYLEDIGGIESLDRALEHFHSVGQDSLQMEVMHGLGLVHFYKRKLETSSLSNIDPNTEFRLKKLRDEQRAYQLQLKRAEELIRVQAIAQVELEKIKQRLYEIQSDIARLEAETIVPDSANIYYTKIIEQNPTYFDSLEIYPHLQSLLFSGSSELMTLEVLFVDEDSRLPLENVNVKGSGEDRFTETTSDRLTLNMFLGERRPFEFSKEGYELKRLTLVATKNRASQTVTLKKVEEQDEVNVPRGQADDLLADITGDWRAVGIDDVFTMAMRILPNSSMLYYAFIGEFELKQTSLDFSRPEGEPQTLVETEPESGIPPFYIRLVNSDLIEMQKIDRATYEVTSTIQYRRYRTNDSDFDGTSDLEDRCPEERGFPNLDGCPPVADADGDGVSDEEDKCPDEVGLVEYGGCLPPNEPQVTQPRSKRYFLTLKDHFVAEPKVLKERNYYDTLFFDGKVYQVILNELSRDGTAQFEVKVANSVAQRRNSYELQPLSKGRTESFDLDRHRFQLEYLGQERRRVNGLRRDVARYVLYLEEDGRPESERVDTRQGGQPNNLERVELTDPVILFLEKDMVAVKGGTFLMGCEDSVEGQCEEDEIPLHDVYISDFSIGKYEVTQELWEAVMGNNPSQFRGCPKCPVENVSWNDTQEFLKKLNEILPNRNFRLPTDAEWEYAARGGEFSDNPRQTYAGTNNIDRIGWYEKNSNNKTHPVGQKNANGLGLFDMTGNVQEWTNDWYDIDYFKQFIMKRASNPEGPYGGNAKVHRGGSWSVKAYYCRNAQRSKTRPVDKYSNIGFRIVKDK